MPQTAEKNDELLKYTSDIVSSFVSNNTLSKSDTLDLLRSVYACLGSLNDNNIEVVNMSVPAVSIEDSVTEDFLICLEDGKRLKMLKRYLKARYNMTPDEYREKWGLPVNYPMVAPNYAQRRRVLAKEIGLGKRAVDKRTIR